LIPLKDSGSAILTIDYFLLNLGLDFLFNSQFKNPCFFAEGGEKEEKSRGKKNEKAIKL